MISTRSKRASSHLTPSRGGDAQASSPLPSKNSSVWAFFSICTEDRSVAICNLCLKRIKRGKNPSRLGTTCLIRHMNSSHAACWKQNQEDTLERRAAIAPRTTSKASKERDDGLAMDAAAACAQPASSTPTGDLSRQISLPQVLHSEKKYGPTHPHAQLLNASLAKLLALQLLPFHLVDSAPFLEFAKCAVPKWQVPKGHFFSHKAIPALYCHVEGNIVTSLGKAVSSKVHITADTWSSRHDQGCYITFTAHWVNLLAAGMDAGQGSVPEPISPPRLQKASGEDDKPVCSTYSSSSSSSTSSSSSMASSAKMASEPIVIPKCSKDYATSVARRCHAVLQLVCLGDRCQSGAEILSALQGQAQRWLMPQQLDPGMVVCDTGTNLLSALRQGHFTHVPCLAHILNLVVQRFLNGYPGLQDLLRQARKVCCHFQRSYAARARLAEIQWEFNLPINRLICDMPTRWNSTLAMLKRLHTQQRAINEYLFEYNTRTGSAELGSFSPHQWLLVKDACTVLSPFEEATRMVRRDNACISDTIPLVFLLEHTLCGIKHRALETVHQKEEEDFLYSQGHPYADAIAAGLQNTQEEEEEEEEDCGSMEVEDNVPNSSRDAFQSPEASGVIRGWEEVVPDSVILSDPEDSESHGSPNLWCMGSLILQSLQKDPKICGIKDRDHYWLATLLDPRYKGKVAELMLPSQREHKMKHLEDLLKKNVCNTFPDPGKLTFPGQRVPEGSVSQRRSRGENGRLTEAFKQFFSPQRPELLGLSTHRQRLHHMVQDYLGTKTDLESFSNEDPLSYWVLRMDHWPELAQYAIELLGCPASSVLSEGTFRAAGGFLTDKRVRLATEYIDHLTFIKMNQSWISSSSYQAPDADVAD